MKRRNVSTRVSKRFLDIQKAEMPHEIDFGYWLIHALHWHAFLLAVVSVLTVGYTVFR